MRKIKAFSLLEVALTIVIFGVAISMVIPIMQTITFAKKQKLNEEKYITIRIAMQNYLLRNGYLPKAANQHGEVDAAIYKGHVPYKELGLSKKDIYDANGNLFTYAVNKNLTKQESKNYLPVTQPFSCAIGPNSVTFCRLYKQDQKNNITEYDTICSSHENIEIFDKNQSTILKNDYIFILDPIKKFPHVYEYYNWQEKALQNTNPSNKNCNTIAWVLISHGKSTNNDSISKQHNLTQQNKFYIEAIDDKIFNDQLFYQTRFDMAAQIGFPCTKEPIYMTTSESSPYSNPLPDGSSSSNNVLLF